MESVEKERNSSVQKGPIILNTHQEDEEIRNEHSNNNSNKEAETGKSSAINDCESTTQITEIKENEGEYENNSLPYKTPNQLVMYKSPEFRMSDYLVFNKQGESIDLNQLMASPAQSLASSSPEFRFTDYILVHKSGDSKNDNQLISSPAYATGYKSPEVRLLDNLTIRNPDKNATHAGLISSPNESFDNRVSGNNAVESDENEPGKCHNKDDEDKENQDEEDAGSGRNGKNARKNREKGDIQTKSEETKKNDAPSSTLRSARKQKPTAATKNLKVKVC